MQLPLPPILSPSLCLDGVEMVALSTAAGFAAGASGPREAMAGDVQEGEHPRLRPLRDEMAEARERHAARTPSVDGRRYSCHVLTLMKRARKMVGYSKNSLNTRSIVYKG